MKLKTFLFALNVMMALACIDTPDLQPQNNQIFIYPNPVKNAVGITVSNSDLNSFTIEVFDAKGNVFLKETGNEAVKQYNLDLRNESNGEFHVILRIGKSEVTKTFIKIG